MGGGPDTGVEYGSMGSPQRQSLVMESRRLESVVTTDTKISPLNPRICSAETTEARLRRVIDHLPITRVANLTPLDLLGVPVWSAITPLARDLTTHMGKGTSHQTARVSALMEAVERCSAEATTMTSRWASWRELTAAGLPTLDPHGCDLPADTAFTKEGVLEWIAAEDLWTGESVNIPTDLAISPPTHGVLRHVDTNGLASGNSLLEATVHALTEVIERDAMGQHLFADLYCAPADGPPPRCRIDPRSWPGSSAQMAETLRTNGLDVLVDWLPTDIAVPTFRALVLDPVFPCGGDTSPCGFVGYGTAPDPDLALQRAITEAIQSRLAVIQGARDTFNRYPCAPSGYSWDYQTMAQPLYPFEMIQGFRSLSLKEDLNWLQQRLQRAGFNQILRIDLTRPDLQIPVVRVRVPGLSSFAVDQSRVGWRCLRFLL